MRLPRQISRYGTRGRMRELQIPLTVLNIWQADHNLTASVPPDAVGFGSENGRLVAAIMAIIFVTFEATISQPASAPESVHVHRDRLGISAVGGFAWKHFIDKR